MFTVKLYLLGEFSFAVVVLFFNNTVVSREDDRGMEFFTLITICSHLAAALYSHREYLERVFIWESFLDFKLKFFVRIYY